MQRYQFLALNKEGKKIKGVVEASSLDEALYKIHLNELYVLDINSTESQKKVSKKEKVKTDEIVIFTKQLASLVAAGIPIVKSLNILADQTQNYNFRNIIIDIRRAIESGESLANAFSKYPKVFSPLFVNMVNAGEFSGNLDVVLERLSSYLKSYNDLVKKVRSAMTYPAAIVIFAICIMIGLFTFVVPGFQKMFEGLGANLPLPTLILITISKVINKNIAIIVITIVILLVLFFKFKEKPQFAIIKEKFIRKIPVINTLFHKMTIARFVKTLAILTRSRVPLLSALIISAQTSGSAILEKKIKAAKDEIAQGNKIMDSLKKTEFFPYMMLGMIGVGEESGDLPNMLERIAEIYDEEINNAVESLLSLIEPAIIVFLGTVIGGIVLCLFLPILQMPKLISGAR